MAFKIYVENNHIVVQDLISDKEFRAASKDALIFKDKISENIYNTEGFFPEGLQGINFSDIIDENEIPFVNEQAFIDFFSENTGNFNQGGSSSLPTVDSVNGKTGVVVLNATDVGAEPTRVVDENYVTDVQLVIIDNTSGTNSGDNATNTTSNSYADAKVASELASFKTSNFLDFTSSGQNQLNGKSATIISSTTQVNNIAVATEQYMQGYPILANTIPDNCVLNLLVKFFKASAGGFSLTCRVYVNTTNSLVGATLIAQTTAGGAAVSDATLYRNIIIRGSNLIILSTSSTLNNDLENVSSSTPSTISFDRSVNQFLIVSFTVPNSSINNLNSVNLTKL